MLRCLPEWWMQLMEWTDTSTVPIWIALTLGTLYFIFAFWRDLHALRRGPPPSNS